MPRIRPWIRFALVVGAALGVAPTRSAAQGTPTEEDGASVAPDSADDPRADSAAPATGVGVPMEFGARQEDPLHPEDETGELVSRWSRSYEGIRFGYDDGFYFVTPDDRFLLQFNGLVQGRGSFVEFDDAFAPTQIGAEDNVNLEVRTARLYATGHLASTAFTYQFAGEFPSSEAPGGNPGDEPGRARLLDAFANLELDPALQFRGGQFKIPFSRGVLVHDWAVSLPERALPIDGSPVHPLFNFGPGREPGAMIWGLAREGTLEYYAAVSNGQGLNQDNDDTHVRWTARVAVNPLGPLPYEEGAVGGDDELRVAIGGGFTYNPENDPLGLDPVDPNVHEWNLDGAIRWGRFYLQGEGFMRLTKRESPLADGRDWGWYGQVGAFVVPESFELIVRVAEVIFDPDVDQPSTFFPQGDVEAVVDYTLGAAYYLDGNRLKFQGDVTSRINDPDAGPHTTDQIVRLQMQVFF